MGTQKRERQKANRHQQRATVQAEMTKQAREQSTKKVGRIIAIVAGLVALIVLYNVLTGDDEESGVAQFAPTPEAGSEEEAAEPAEVELLEAVPDDFVPFAGEGALAAVVPAARNGAYTVAPEMTIDPTREYAAVLDTTAGPIRFRLLAAEAPATVNSFVNLAKDGFYDGVVFHRVLEGFMAQGGDPTGTGTGGPGYEFEDEVDNGRAFGDRGLLAMANAGPGTNGSQFFITFDMDPSQAAALDGNHTISESWSGRTTSTGSCASIPPTRAQINRH